MKKLFLIFCLLAALLLSACGTSTTTESTGGLTGASCFNHKDANDDGGCDNCAVSLITPIKLYAINDLHGKFADGDSHIGVDELTTYWKNEQQYNYVILLSTGDMWQGSSESNLTEGMIITDWMNELDFAAMTLGNHEYDWGEDAIEANAAAAEFPMLAINIYDRQTDSRVDYCDASTLVDIGGVQVGIIGAMGDCYGSIAADKTEDVYFVVGDELTQLVMAESDRLRTECGADFIVYVLHDGYGSSTDAETVSGNQIKSYYDTALSNGYVDLVFEAHTHQSYCFADEYGVYHLQNKGDNKGGVSYAQIEINRVTGTVSHISTELISTNRYKNQDDDPIVEQLLEKYAEVIAPADEILGINGEYRNSGQLCQLVAQLYYQLGLEVWGEEYEITLGGGFLSARSPYCLEAGEVKYADLQAVFPFDNDLVLCSIKGEDLLRRFINNNDGRYFVDGQWGEIDPEGTYYIVVDTYTSTYGPNKLTLVAEYTPGIYARDLLAEYIKAGNME